jgi:PAS domain S-box-containing protein
MNDRSDERWATVAQPRPDYCQILIQKSLDIVSVIDRDGIIRFVNPAVKRVLGFSPDDLTGHSLFDILHPEDAGRVKAGLARLAEGLGSGQRAELRVRQKDGSWRTLGAIGRNLGDDSAAPEIVVDTRDVSQRKQALKALRQSRKFARHIAESVPDALVVYDLIQGRFTYANRGVLGYTPEQIREMNREQFAKLVHPDDRAALAGRLRKLERARDGEVFEAEYRLQDRDGNWHWLSSRDTVFKRTREGTPQQTIGAVRDITARKQADSDLESHQAELRRSREELRALAARLLTVAEEERKALSRELHDDFNQRLAILSIDLETMASGLSPAHPLRRDLELLRSRLVELTEDVRRTAYQLRPSILDDLGLVPALRSYCEQFKRRERVAVTFTHANLPERLQPEHALCLYRVAQEALRNIAKHAQTRRAAVVLSGDGGAVALTIRDWGAGFDTEIMHRMGLGIVGMGERVRLAGGSFEVKSRPGYGTEIEVRIPFTAEAE